MFFHTFFAAIFEYKSHLILGKKESAQVMAELISKWSYLPCYTSVGSRFRRFRHKQGHAVGRRTRQRCIDRRTHI
jgi:hypothetical protein